MDFIATRQAGNYLLINDDEGTWILPGRPFMRARKLDEIVSCEMVEDGTEADNAEKYGRAILGWQMFGAIGALVGGASRKKAVCRKLYVKITLTDETMMRVDLITSEVRKDSAAYQDAIGMADQIVALLSS